MLKAILKGKVKITYNSERMEIAHTVKIVLRN